MEVDCKALELEAAHKHFRGAISHFVKCFRHSRRTLLASISLAAKKSDFGLNASSDLSIVDLGWFLLGLQPVSAIQVFPYASTSLSGTSAVSSAKVVPPSVGDAPESLTSCFSRSVTAQFDAEDMLAI